MRALTGGHNNRTHIHIHIHIHTHTHTHARARTHTHTWFIGQTAGMPTIAATGPGRFTRVVMRALLELPDVARVDEGLPGRQSQHERSHGESSEADDRGRGDGLGGDGDNEPLGRVVILPTNFVFPLPNSLISASAEQRDRMRSTLLATESLAVHHWAGSWLKQHLGLPAWSTPSGLPCASAAVLPPRARVVMCARLLKR